MRLYFITFLLLVLSFGNLNSQEGSKIDLRNVNVGTKRLPIPNNIVINAKVNIVLRILFCEFQASPNIKIAIFITS